MIAIVHNTGGRPLGISGNLSLAAGPGGLRAGPFPVTLGSALAPGDSGSVTVRLDTRLPDGPWLARIQLSSGLIHRASVATITFPALGGPSKPKPAGVAESRPWLVVLLVILLVWLAIAALALLLPRVPRGRGGVGPAATT